MKLGTALASPADVWIARKKRASALIRLTNGTWFMMRFGAKRIPLGRANFALVVLSDDLVGG